MTPIRNGMLGSRRLVRSNRREREQRVTVIRNGGIIKIETTDGVYANEVVNVCLSHFTCVLVHYIVLSYC